MLIKRLFCLSAIILLLSGCQQTTRKAQQPVTPAPDAPAPAAQVAQLAAVIAGGEYLRQQCNDEQVLAHEALLAQIIDQAQRRGWDTQHSAYLTLSGQSEGFYQGLLSDSTPVETQCDFFQHQLGALVKTR